MLHPNATQSFVAGAPIAILGVPFDNVTTRDAVTLVEEMVASRQPHYLVTANVDFLVQAREDIELRRILFDAHLVLCDGTPLVWASRLLGNPLPERVAGADLVPLLIRIAARKDYRVFFLGGTPESTAGALARIKSEFPQLKIDGYAPPFNQLLEMDHDEIKRRIRQARPDFLFVSFGCPKQEKWLAMHYQSLGVPVCAGVGGTIDFLAGQVKRAPLWMQRTGAEWIFRLAQEPRRLLGRYVKDLAVFGSAIAAQWWRLKPHRHHIAAHHEVSIPLQARSSWLLVRLPERLDAAAVQNDSFLHDQALTEGRHCFLDSANVRFIDSSGVGALIRLHKKSRAADRQLVLLAPSRAVTRALELMRLQEFFAVASDLAGARRLVEARSLEQQAVVASRPDAADALVWQGEITAANAETVWRSTRPRVAHLSVPGHLTLDLSHVRFMDSSGLSVMLRAQRLARRRGIKLDVTGAQPPVRNVLRIARLENLVLGDHS